MNPNYNFNNNMGSQLSFDLNNNISNSNNNNNFKFNNSSFSNNINNKLQNNNYFDNINNSIINRCNISDSIYNNINNDLKIVNNIGNKNNISSNPSRFINNCNKANELSTAILNNNFFDFSNKNDVLKYNTTKNTFDVNKTLSFLNSNYNVNNNILNNTTNQFQNNFKNNISMKLEYYSPLHKIHNSIFNFNNINQELFLLKDDTSNNEGKVVLKIYDENNIRRSTPFKELLENNKNIPYINILISIIIKCNIFLNNSCVKDPFKSFSKEERKLYAIIFPDSMIINHFKYLENEENIVVNQIEEINKAILYNQDISKTIKEDKLMHKEITNLIKLSTNASCKSTDNNKVFTINNFNSNYTNVNLKNSKFDKIIKNNFDITDKLKINLSIENNNKVIKELFSNSTNNNKTTITNNNKNLSNNNNCTFNSSEYVRNYKYINKKKRPNIKDELSTVKEEFNDNSTSYKERNLIINSELKNTKIQNNDYNSKTIEDLEFIFKFNKLMFLENNKILSINEIDYHDTTCNIKDLYYFTQSDFNNIRYNDEENIFDLNLLEELFLNINYNSIKAINNEFIFVSIFKSISLIFVI